MRFFRTFSLLFLLMTGGAWAQCAGGLIVNCPTAVSPQPTDVLQLWQLGQNPHMRKVPLSGVLSESLAGVDLSASTATATGTSTIYTLANWMRQILGLTGIPGCASNGTTDDTACVQAAFTAGGPINLGAHIYAINSTGLVCNTPVYVTGTQGNQTANFGTISGFRPLSTNETLLTLSSGCDGSKFGSFSMDMGAPGTNTSGAAISMAAALNNTTLTDIAINAPCIGVDLNGNTIKMDRIQVTQVSGAACGGLRIGHLTTMAATVDPRITNSTFQSVQSANGTPGGFGIRLEDAGGYFQEHNDVLFFASCTVILPGTNQQVDYGKLGKSDYGDTCASHALTIDTAASSAVVKGISAVDGWASSSQAGDGITVNNSGGGIVSGIHFVGMQIYNNNGNGVNVLSPSVTDLTVDDSHFCGQSASYDEILLASGVSGAAIRNNKLGNSCDGFSSAIATGLALAGANANLIITGNKFDGATSPAGGVPIGDSVVSGNTMLDTQTASAASAATVSLNAMYSTWSITGTTTVTALSGGWNGRRVTLFSTTSGGFTITPGAGSSCSVVNLVTNDVPVDLTYNAGLGCWLVK